MRKRLRLTKRQQAIVATVKKLGWASGPLLAFLFGTEPGGRNYYLEEYLPGLVRAGSLCSKAWGRQNVYRLAAYGAGRKPKIEHAMAAGWAVARILRSAGADAECLVDRSVLVRSGVSQVADTGLLLPLSNGRHLFLVEYQSARESERTTGEKVAGYKQCAETIRQTFAADGVWVVFILDVMRQRAVEIAQRHQDGWPLFFFCDRESLMTSNDTKVARTKMFFWSGAPGDYPLIDDE